MGLLQRWKDRRKTYAQIEAQERLKEEVSQLVFQAMGFSESEERRRIVSGAAGYSSKFLSDVLGGSVNLTLEQVSDLLLVCGYELRVGLKHLTKETTND